MQILISSVETGPLSSDVSGRHAVDRLARNRSLPSWELLGGPVVPIQTARFVGLST
jgi:hypothetical protein